MSNATSPRRSSCGVVLLCLFLFGFAMLVAIVLAGVLVFGFARAEHRVQQAVAAEEMARSQAVHAQAVANMERAERQARDMAAQGEAAAAEAAAVDAAASAGAETANTNEDATAQPNAESPPGPEAPSPPQEIRVAQREVTVSLNAEGKLQVDGGDCEFAQLKDVLSQAIKGREEAVRLTVRVDKRCVFEHVSAVLAVCRELDVRDVRITDLDR